jgi:hypothetical protein
MRTAKIRPQISSGSTSASGPYLSASTWRANPSRVPPTDASHRGCRIRSRKIRGDSGWRDLTRLVLRWSATEATPNTSAAATAATTAMTRLKCPSSLPGGHVDRV